MTPPRYARVSTTFVIFLTIASLTSMSAPASASEQNLEAAVAAYGAAWAARDVDQIIALHAEETEFRIFVENSLPAIGKKAIREQFKGVFASNPSYASTVTDMQFGLDFVYIRYQIHMDAHTSAVVGKYTFQPSGESYPVDAMDYIQFKNGLVTRKHTFLDVEDIRAASSEFSALGGSE